MTVNYKGLFVLNAYVSNDGSRIFLQDQAVKFNDCNNLIVPRTERSSDRFSEVLLGRYLPYLLDYISAPVKDA